MYYFFHIGFNPFQIVFTQKISIERSNEAAFCCDCINEAFFFQFIVSTFGRYDTDPEVFGKASDGRQTGAGSGRKY